VFKLENSILNKSPIFLLLELHLEKSNQVELQNSFASGRRNYETEARKSRKIPKFTADKDFPGYE
jgi:hypothetical protein